MAILKEADGARNSVNQFFGIARDWMKQNDYGKGKTNDEILKDLTGYYNDRYHNTGAELTNPEGLNPERLSRMLGIPQGDDEFVYNKAELNNRIDYWRNAIRTGTTENDKRIADYFEKPFDTPEKDMAAVDQVLTTSPRVPEPEDLKDLPTTNVVKPKHTEAQEKLAAKEPEPAKEPAPAADDTPAAEADTVADTGGGEAAAPVAAGLNFGGPEFLTIAGIAAGIAGIIAAIHALSKSIKGRFQKYCKMLFRMQRDFNTKDTGLDMTTIAGDKGNMFTKWFKADNWARWIFGDNKVDKQTQIGVKPFVKMYKDEIHADYDNAYKTFQKVAVAGQGVKESSGDGYESFAEAFKSENINESVLAMASLGLSLVSIASKLTASAGQFNVSMKDKNGQDKLVPVKVTKASTREVCLSIIAQFLEKYVNTEAVFKRMGMDVDRLQDITASDYEKFKKVLESFKQGRDKYSSNQFNYMKKAWDGMLKNYDDAGQRIIKNFRKYTLLDKEKNGKTMKEKDANNLEAAEMKIKTAWDLGITKLKQAFPSVITEITGSDEYITFYDFILEQVLPVFKTGVAGDADHILNSYPKKGEYYFIHQTGQGGGKQVTINAQSGQSGQQSDAFTGAAALVKVLEFKGQDIKFRLISALGGEITRDSSTLQWDLSKADFEDTDQRVYDYREEELPLNKWNSLDPMIIDETNLRNGLGAKADAVLKDPEADWENNTRKELVTPVYSRQYDIQDPSANAPNNMIEAEEFIFGLDYDNSERSVEPREYAEDTALYDSAINESRDNPQVSAVIAIRVFNRNRDFKDAHVTKIELKKRCTVKEFIAELGNFNKKFTEVTDQQVIDACWRLKNKIEETVNINVVDEFETSLASLEKKMPASRQLKGNIGNAIDKLLNKFINLNSQDITDNSMWIQTQQTVENKRDQQYVILNINPGSAKTGASSYAYSSMVVPGMKSSDGKDIVFALLITAVAAASKDASTGKTVFNVNPHTIAFKAYCGPALTIKDVIARLNSLQYIGIPEQEAHSFNINNYVKKIESMFEKSITLLKNNKVIADSMNVSYSSSASLTESAVSDFTTVKRHIDTGKLKDFSNLYTVSEVLWNDGMSGNITESFSRLLSADKAGIEAAAKSDCNILCEKFRTDSEYKVRYPKNRTGVLSAGNSLYESVAVVRFDNKGNIETVYNLGTKKII